MSTTVTFAPEEWAALEKDHRDNVGTRRPEYPTTEAYARALALGQLGQMSRVLATWRTGGGEGPKP